MNKVLDILAYIVVGAVGLVMIWLFLCSFQVVTGVDWFYILAILTGIGVFFWALKRVVDIIYE